MLTEARPANQVPPGSFPPGVAQGFQALVDIYAENPDAVFGSPTLVPLTGNASPGTEGARTPLSPSATAPTTK